jgi:hypothetical protein
MVEYARSGLTSDENVGWDHTVPATAGGRGRMRLEA